MLLLRSFIEPLLMAIELLVADFMFGNLFHKRKGFYFRAIFSILLCLEIVVLIAFFFFLITGDFFPYDTYETEEINYQLSIFKFFYYLTTFLLTILCVKICYKDSIWYILCYCSCAYAMQHISKNICSLFTIIPSLSQAFNTFPWLMYLINFFVFLIVYLIIYFTLIHGKFLVERPKGIKKKIIISITVVIVCIGLSRITKDDINRGNLAVFAETLYAAISCFLILFILSDMTETDKILYESDAMKDVMRREAEHYKFEKENIDLINIKCHDLKHQINALKQNNSNESIKKIADAVMIYDSIMKTGNDILDVILSEKCLYCEKNQIDLTCIAQGKSLSFMDDMDIYSLFGNALSNAIEAVNKIKNRDKRAISMKVEPIGNMLSIHIENYYEGELQFEKELPKTNRDKDYHGYGMKSMEYIVKQYNGHMSILSKNGKFQINFLFPIKN